MIGMIGAMHLFTHALRGRRKVTARKFLARMREGFRARTRQGTIRACSALVRNRCNRSGYAASFGSRRYSLSRLSGLHTRRKFGYNSPMQPNRRLGPSISCFLVLLAIASGSGLAQSRVADHQYTTADIRAGARLYRTECALCHLSNGDGVDGIDLRLGRFRRVMSDDDLRESIRAGNPDAGMPAFPLHADELDRLVAFIRAGFDPSGVVVNLGDAKAGESLFAGKGSCAECHRVNGRGPRTAPDLSDIGATRTPAALQRKLLDPSSAMMPINRPVRIVTRDGVTIHGRRLNEDTYSVQLIDSRERLVSLNKADIVEYEIAMTSLMPEAPLTDVELADVIAYLLTLRGLE